MRTAALRGREHPLLGAIAAIAEGRAAITLSIGGAKKRYAHVEPNEDVAAFAVGDAGVLLAVADGHGGDEAAEAAVDRIVTRHAARWTDRPDAFLHQWTTIAPEAMLDANSAILARAAAGGRASARTTLSLALIRPADGAFAYASVGDSHVFQVADLEVVDRAAEPDRAPGFLGAPSDSPNALLDRCVAGCEELAGTRGVVLATDGLSERGIGVDVAETTVSECVAGLERVEPELRSLTAARALVAAALDAHRRHRAGDNVAAAVVWLG